MNLKQSFYFITLSLLWGASFLAIKYVVIDLPPAFGALLRVSIGLAAVGFLILFQPKTYASRSIRWQSFGAGIFNMGIPWLLLFSAEKEINPALGSIYNSTTTIFAALFTPIFLSHIKLSRQNILGIIVGFVWVLVVFGPNISSHDIRQTYSRLVSSK